MTTSLQQKIAGLLGKRDSLTSSVCVENIEKISVRLEKIRARTARTADIHSWPTGRGKLGPERERVAETGSPSDLIKLKQEEELLEAEESSLCHQRDALRERLKKAAIEESPALVKVAIKKLGPALKSAETATRSLAKSTAILESVKDEIRTARRTATDADIKAPVVKPDDFDRLAELLGWNYSKPPFISESNVRNARSDRRAELTGWMPDQPAEPEMPWQRVERMRQFKARDKRKAVAGK